MDRGKDKKTTLRKMILLLADAIGFGLIVYMIFLILMSMPW